jgi:subtilisin family serine protease
MKKLIVSLFLLVLGNGAGVSAVDLPPWVRQSRPADAPALAIPAFAAIDAALQQRGAARVIVRLAPPTGLTGGFAPEGHLRDKAAVNSQRAAIAHMQNRVLAKLSQLHGAAAKRFDFIPFMAVEVDPAEFQQLAASPDIDLIEEDIPVPPTLSQSVPLIGAVGGAFSGASGSGQTVAILDTGVDKTHPFLSGKVVAEACYSTTYAGQSATAVCTDGSTAPGAGANCNASITGCDHGTHVAGIAAGNNASFSGVARDATIIAVQVFSQFPIASCGTGATAPCVMSYTSDQISGLQHIYDLRSSYAIASVNMSLGGGSFSSYCDANASYTAEKAAIDNLRAVGIATVIAAGNDGATTAISAPACISTAVSVGATSKSDAVAYYSNSAAILRLLAPGSAIYSSVPAGGYASWNGTSMATPHVTGAWAVLKSAKPTAGVDEVLNALVMTGVSITDARNSVVKPRIKVDAAVNGMLGYNVAAGVTGGNGSVSSANPLTISIGATAAFTVAPATGYRSNSSVSGSCPAGSFSGNNYTTGAITAPCSVNFSFIPLSFTISTGVSGNGAVSCTPAATVDYNTPTSCTATAAAGNHITAVTVDGTAQTVSDPASFSYPFGAVTANHSISASFNPNQTVKIAGTPAYYATLQAAYNAAGSVATIQAETFTFFETLVFDMPSSVTLEGGMDSSFLTTTGLTTISGSLVVSNGMVTLNNIVIQ